MEKLEMGQAHGSRSGHNYLHAGLILFGLFSFVVSAGMSGYNGTGLGYPDVFVSTVSDIATAFQIYITPAGTTFIIWTVIYLWTAVSLIMFLVTIFLTNSKGRVYLSPPIATPSVMVTFSLNQLLQLAWLFTWDRSTLDPNNTIYACILLILTAITNILVMVFLARNITNYAGDLSPRWAVAYRLVLNGLGIWATWAVIAMLINLTTALVYPGGLDQTNCCLAALSLLVVCHVTWFILENFVIDKYARYILTPYMVVVWAVNGIRAKKLDDPDVPQVIKNYIIAILVIAGITLIVRIAIFIFREIRQPLHKRSPIA